MAQLPPLPKYNFFYPNMIKIMINMITMIMKKSWKWDEATYKILFDDIPVMYEQEVNFDKDLRYKNGHDFFDI